MSKSYRTGLFSCFSDMQVCCLGTFYPCCLNASNFARVRDENCTFFHCLFPTHPFWVRQMVREQKGIPKDVARDCAIITFCAPCAICQDARELFGTNLDSTPLLI